VTGRLRAARLLLLCVSACLAAAPASEAEPPEARALRRRLDDLNIQLEEQRERLVLATVALGGIAAALDTHAPGSPQAAAARKAALAAVNEAGANKTALALEAALIAERLRRCKETGVLAPLDAETIASLTRAVESSWTAPPSTRNVPKLSLDLAELQKQVRPYWDLGRGPAPERAIAPAPRVPAPAAKREAPLPKFERDAGTGRPSIDPVPELIVELSSSSAARRALAADALGVRGADAAPAVPALRRALADPDRRVRASAALALGAAGDASVADDLRRALGDPDEEVRLNARAALRRLGATR